MKTYRVNAFGRNWNLSLFVAHYQNNGRLAILVKDADTKEPFGTLTVNIDAFLPDDPEDKVRFAFVKTYSENEAWAPDLLEELRSEGVAERIFGMEVSNGNVEFPLWGFDTAKLLEVVSGIIS